MYIHAKNLSGFIQEMVHFLNDLSGFIQEAILKNKYYFVKDHISFKFLDDVLILFILNCCILMTCFN